MKPDRAIKKLCRQLRTVDDQSDSTFKFSKVYGTVRLPPAAVGLPAQTPFGDTITFVEVRGG